MRHSFKLLFPCLMILYLTGCAKRAAGSDPADVTDSIHREYSGRIGEEETEASCEDILCEDVSREDVLCEDVLTEDNEEKISEGHVHTMEVLWYGGPPSCTQGGYRIEMCSECGWVDEERTGSVPPLEHELSAKEIQHGNCVEDTILVYICNNCKEQIKYERYPEPEAHEWVLQTITVWDETEYCFREEQIYCCKRCNAVLL